MLVIVHSTLESPTFAYVRPTSTTGVAINEEKKESLPSVSFLIITSVLQSPLEKSATSSRTISESPIVYVYEEFSITFDTSMEGVQVYVLTIVIIAITSMVT